MAIWTDQIVCIIWRFSKTNPLSCHSLCWLHVLTTFLSLPCPLHGPFRDFKPRRASIATNQDTPLRLVGQVVDFDIRPCPVRNNQQPWNKKNNEFERRKTWKSTQKEAWRDFHIFASEKQVLVGGFSSVEKYYYSQIGSSPQGSGWK